MNQRQRIESALVTGGAGFIGSHLVDALVGLGTNVRVIDNLSTGFRQNLSENLGKIEWLEGDIRDPNVLDRAMRNVEVVFHVAAMPSVPRSVKEPLLSLDINFSGTLQVLEAARRFGVRRVVFSSSSSVYGETPTLPKMESHAARPLSPYAVAKHAAEEIGRVFDALYQVEFVGLRYFNVYGPRQDPQSAYAAVIPLFFRAAAAKNPCTIFGDGEQTRDFTFVGDVVRANLLSATAAPARGEVFNIAGGTKTTVNELASLIYELAGFSTIPQYAPARSGDIRHSHAAIDKANRLLGWQPQVPLREGLRQTLAWFSKR